MSRTALARVAAASVVVAALVAAPSARADYEETEARLKLARVDDALRARIHEAIDRGAKWLLAHQEKDGSFRAPIVGDVPAYVDGLTALASLALAHAGTPGARAGAERGLAYLVVDGEPRRGLVESSYSCGAAAMLLVALHGDAHAARRLGAAASAGLKPAADWWGYAIGSGATAPDGLEAKLDDENISTSQFAALGLWAAGRLGGAAHARTWRRHLEALCALQTKSGSWPYWAARPGGGGAGGYPNATCMGFANLTLARAALEEEIEDDPSLAARSELARRRGREALDRDGPAVLVSHDTKLPTAYYGLYALEKACVFADIATVGGRAWYVDGATRLVNVQHDDGGWAGPSPSPPGARIVTGPAADVVNTSFALLFLLRDAETLRPTTPRGIGEDVVTPGRAPPPTVALPPTQTVVTSESADAALDRLLALLRAKPPAAADLVQALDDVERARAGLGATASGAWLDREEKLVVKVLRDALGPLARDEDDDVAVRAATVLGGARSGVAGDVRQILGEVLSRGDVDPPPRRVLGAAFGALARLGGAASFEWLVARVSADPSFHRVRAARTALGALASFGGVEPLARMQTVSKIVHLLSPIERAAAAAGDDVDGLKSTFHWEALRAAALAAVEHLCVDAAGLPPTGPDGAPLLSLAAYDQWLARHRDVGAPPWK